MTAPDFIPGLELSRGFFHEAVAPLLDRAFPGLLYSAALIGDGSEVLGYDTPMSADHHWGPRVMVFLSSDDYEARHEDVRVYLGRNLPHTYRGYSTNFTDPDPGDNGVQLLAPASGSYINHRVELRTIDGFFRDYLNLSIAEPMAAADWLSLPSQKLRSVVSGGVFRDDFSLEIIRQRLKWYPRDVWLYILGCCWTRIGQEEHLMGRAGFINDEAGSALIGARLVRDIMRIAFLLESEYPPYPKWFGTAFNHLSCALQLRPHLEEALRAGAWQERQSALSRAYEALVQIQRAHAILDDASGLVSDFWGRPFLVIHGGKIAEAIFSQIVDPGLLHLSRSQRIGSIDLITDNTDLLEDVSMRPLMRALYRA